MTLLSFALAAVMLIAFVVIEARSEQPLLPLRLFENRTRVGAYVVMLITGAAVFAMFYFLTQFVQNVIGFSPLKAGLRVPTGERHDRRRRADREPAGRDASKRGC